MSHITLLGFAPSASLGSNIIHWSILLSPTQHTPENESTVSQTTKTKSSSFFSSTRRLSSKAKTNTSAPETVLFDMHNHQLRQQAFPVRTKKEAASDEDTGSSPGSLDFNSSRDSGVDMAANLARQTTTSISSDLRNNQRLHLSLRIVLARHHLSVSRLTPRVATLLYRTPTYGPDDDWLRAALDMLVGSGILEPAASFDPDAVLAFVGDAVKEYLLRSQAEKTETSVVLAAAGKPEEVLELDYAAHIASMEEVKAMFANHRLGAGAGSTPPSPPYTPSSTPAPTSTSPARRRSSSTDSAPRRQSKSNSFFSKSAGGGGIFSGAHKFLGLRISPSPTSIASRRHASADEHDLENTIEQEQEQQEKEDEDDDEDCSLALYSSSCSTLSPSAPIKTKSKTKSKSKSKTKSKTNKPRKQWGITRPFDFERNSPPPHGWRESHPSSVVEEDIYFWNYHGTSSWEWRWVAAVV